jgi:hypothetical protein
VRVCACVLQCGGSAAGVRAAKPLLQLMGKTVEHLGEHGAGQVGPAAAAVVHRQQHEQDNTGAITAAAPTVRVLDRLQRLMELAAAAAGAPLACRRP